MSVHELVGMFLVALATIVLVVLSVLLGGLLRKAVMRGVAALSPRWTRRPAATPAPRSSRR